MTEFRPYTVEQSIEVDIFFDAVEQVTIGSILEVMQSLLIRTAFVTDDNRWQI